MDIVGHSAVLRAKIALTDGDLGGANDALWNHPRLAALFPEYLFWIHATIRASVPLMEAARARAASLADGDPVAAAIAGYLAHHIREERHHDDWVLDDLEVLGVPRRDVLARIPLPLVAAAVGAQYYYIHHYHPVALLGYIAVLEGSPPTVEHLESVVARTGLPKQAFRTLFKHAHLDIHHRDDLDAMLDALPLAPEHAAAMAISAFGTTHLLGRALQHVVDSYPQ